MTRPVAGSTGQFTTIILLRGHGINKQRPND